MRIALAIAPLVLAGSLLAAPPPLPPTPAPVGSLVLAQPFELEEGFHFTWRADRPLVTSGHLLVLAVDPDLVYPRQTAEPILYVGNQTAMRLNVAYPSGTLLALVPGELEQNGTRIWFGTPGLPEQVTPAGIAQAAELAAAEGISPLAAVDVAGALERGGPAVRAADLDALLDAAEDLLGR
jgi:hypothetical protein